MKTIRHSLLKGITTLNPDSETLKLPSRDDMIKRIKQQQQENEHGIAEFDLLIIGGGATGSGAALEAATRGLKVLCVEREDFASGTSSRSTKLLWGGSRYLVQAFVNLLSVNVILSPLQTFNKFYHEFKMVMHCHRERNFMLKQQPHLCSWQPIAVPLKSWLLWPPPFHFYPAAVGPLGLFPAFFKFYDALSGFSSPPSHIMNAARSERKFPQLANNEIKYCSVFYEGMHDDARTNLAIAQTAAIEGAIITNYCEVTAFIKDETNPDKVVGAVIVDKETNEHFIVKAKSILLCGGPFTDEIRKLEDEKSKEAVTGASGIHIILPAYYNPTGIGLVDMNTSDGRFLFFLPWQDHVLVGTTDHKCQATSRPVPDEAEIQWLLHEASKYLSPELQFRRKDVLSAWAGIRPLASDPHSKGTAGVSRDHVISYNPKSGLIFVSGGKWTTFRQMAEEAVDAVIRSNPQLQQQGGENNNGGRKSDSSSSSSPSVRKRMESNTLNMHYIGFKGYTANLPIRLIQQYGISPSVAQRLTKAYGGRAHDVLQIAKEISTSSANGNHGGTTIVTHSNPLADFEMSNPNSPNPSPNAPATPTTTAANVITSNALLGNEKIDEKLLVKGFPILEAEVIFATRYEWVLHPEDFLAHRTRLAFVNRNATITAIPRVVELMAKELNWNEDKQELEIKRCLEFMKHIGGSTPLNAPISTATALPVRMGIYGDMLDAFLLVDKLHNGYITPEDLPLFSELLHYSITEKEMQDCISFIQGDKAVPSTTEEKTLAVKEEEKEIKITFDNLFNWWNSERMNPGLVELRKEKMANITDMKGSGTMFG